jgi:predicted CopG family antitoxin
MYIHTDMGVKTISVSDEAYARLKSLKKAGESFSDVINRLTSRKRLSEIAGALNDEDVDVIESAIASIRSRSRDRTANLVKEMSN